MTNILLIDDTSDFRERLSARLRELKYHVKALDNAEEGLELLSKENHGIDMVLVDYRMPRMDGLEFLKDLVAREVRVPAILLTGAYNDDAGIEASKLGVFKCVIKSDFDDLLRELEPIIRNVMDIRGRPVPPEPPPKTGAGNSLLVGTSARMLDLHRLIGRMAPLDESVLILGETGTGKGLVAQLVHKHSRRAAAPFLAINCAAIPENLLERELFGHEKGAFGGADRRRIGKFEQYSGGTILLDEIGEMEPRLQAKMLRLLQEQRFERIGGNETLQTDVRLLFATNVNLEATVADGRFRADLLYRLKGFTITVPPLRDRIDDLPLLLAHFLPLFSRDLGREVRSVAPEALEILRRYPWPGNIRDLQNVLRQALLQATGPVLLPEFLPPLTNDGPAVNQPRSDADPCTKGKRILLEAKLNGEKISVIKLAEQMGVTRPQLYENAEFASVREMASKLFKLFTVKASRGSYQGPRGSKNKDGRLEAQDTTEDDD